MVREGANAVQQCCMAAKQHHMSCCTSVDLLQLTFNPSGERRLHSEARAGGRAFDHAGVAVGHCQSFGDCLAGLLLVPSRRSCKQRPWGTHVAPGNNVGSLIMQRAMAVR